MTRRPLLLWGTCWLGEDVTVVERFLHRSAAAARELGVDVELVVFDARDDRCDAERVQLGNTSDVKLIRHRVSAYPNKNLGIAAIVAHGRDLGADVVAIVDADWAFDSLEDFVRGLLSPILVEDATGVLPDIGVWAGRANRLVGVPAMELLRPGMSTVVATPFPGAVAAKTEALSTITSSPVYHFDWGGEWDIANGLWSLGPVASPRLGMVNVRHRTTASKAGDAFQIWRAILRSSDGVSVVAVNTRAAERAERALGVTGLVARLSGSATEQLAAIASAPAAPPELHATINQLIPMVLAPLAFLLDGTDTLTLTFPSDDTRRPYDRSKLTILGTLATFAAGSALGARRVGSELHWAKTGGPLGTWDDDRERAARALVAGRRWI